MRLGIVVVVVPLECEHIPPDARSLLLYCLVSQTVYVVTVRTHRPVIKQKYTNFPSNCENGEEY